MNQVAIYRELKDDRSLVRKRIFAHIQKVLLCSMESGFFPDMREMIEEIMSEISQIMDEFPDISAQAWNVILQGKEPSKSCEKTRRLVDELAKCKQKKSEESGAPAAEKKNP